MIVAIWFSVMYHLLGVEQIKVGDCRKTENLGQDDYHQGAKRKEIRRNYHQARLARSPRKCFRRTCFANFALCVKLLKRTGLPTVRSNNSHLPYVVSVRMLPIERRVILSCSFVCEAVPSLAFTPCMIASFKTSSRVAGSIIWHFKLGTGAGQAAPAGRAAAPFGVPRAAANGRAGRQCSRLREARPSCEVANDHRASRPGNAGPLMP